MSIKKNFFYNVLLNVTNILAPLVTTPYVLRMLGPDGIGKVNYAMSLMGFFLAVVQTGLNFYAVKEIAKVRDDKTKLNRTFSELFLVNSIMSIIALVLYAAAVALVDNFRVDMALFVVVGLNIAVNLFSIDWFYSGIEDYRYISMRSVAVKLIYVGLIFLVIRGHADYMKLAIIGVVIMVIGNFINMTYAFTKIKLFFKGLDLSKHFKPVRNMLFVGIAAGIASKLDAVLLGYMTGPEYVGYYTINRNLIILVITFISALGAVIAPRLSYYLNKGMKKEYNETAEKSLNFIYFAGFPAVALIVLLSDEILLLFGGPKFLAGSLSLKILAFYILIIELSIFLGYQVIMPNNDEKILAITAVPGLAVSLIINLLFIKSYFHLAPSVALVLAETTAVVVQYFLARKYISFRVFKRQSANYLIASILLSGIVYYIRTLLHADYLVVLFICPLVFMSLYIGFLFAVKDENVFIILNTVLKRIKISA